MLGSHHGPRSGQNAARRRQEQAGAQARDQEHGRPLVEHGDAEHEPDAEPEPAISPLEDADDQQHSGRPQNDFHRHRRQEVADGEKHGDRRCAQGGEELCPPVPAKLGRHVRREQDDYPTQERRQDVEGER